MDSRKEELVKVEAFKKTLPEGMSEEGKRKKLLSFMAENGLRQLGEPIIGKFADKIMPDPLHIEINSWTHALNLGYSIALDFDMFEPFITALKAPVNLVPGQESGIIGCGLFRVAKSIEEHYARGPDARKNKIPTRLIGAQAIALARYSHRLVDAIKLPHESGVVKLKRLALSKIYQSLRDIGSLINQVEVENRETYTEDVATACRVYFNLYSLYFPSQCQITVWTMGYIVPYHTKQLFEQYDVGFGIISMQGKEAKHSEIKQCLKSETNRSTSQGEGGKWFQLMRSSFVRNFYIPYHFTLSSSYYSHFQTRKKFVADSCDCSRPAATLQGVCETCVDAYDVFECAKNGDLSPLHLKTLLPQKCSKCNVRFADKIQMENHLKTHNLSNFAPNRNFVAPRNLKIKDLKLKLTSRNLSTVGTKDVLVKRLESALKKEI